MTQQKFFLNRVSIDRQGYDSHGRYWGVGAPLFLWEEDGGRQDSGFLRAKDRKVAKEILRKQFPNARFYR